MDVVVRQGDSFWDYSRLFKITLQLIIDSNREVQATQLQIGQKVKIPGFVAVDYKIRPGDSIWHIARSNNVELDGLFLVNPGLSSHELRVGQIMTVPVRVTWSIVQARQLYDYDKMMSDLRWLKKVYPFLTVLPIGRSVQERELPEVIIGNGRKRVHFNGSFHGNEWITTVVIMTYLNDYLLALTNNTWIRGLPMYPYYKQTTLSIVPMVNPDGVNLVLNGPPEEEPWHTRVVELNGGSKDFTRWKANIKGVDLNDQFPAKWEKERERNPKQPGPRDYTGEKPLTEPEAIAVAQLISMRDFAMVLAFHTQGEVIYWGFDNLEPPESQTIVTEFGRVSGYEPVKTIESYAGCKDWFIQEWRRPGFTIELGRGINPLPISQFDKIYQEALGIFLAALYM
ncbi:M14 family metallopeptidase [Bacillus sp. T33-2]|uniref:M14 family metallopeptidase n=1 Tax=Bacillus sp. T33-2 TaxID=2054168 RepID=UPI000C77ACD1|nr:M14 family metallopeptidase [Bacillus sp. T33-2]PLR96934.1 peptidase M14 [Bacillus sp. T33-2]